ncbi:MAG: hypothetical protein JG774_1852 [Desulfomicrobiaceae bacterium]|jgi:hypothetical protein|nr:hypothetical protein [Desulfomicrobiaceae bacterium]MBZ4686107.1 hypothetical protein [Desulfomicrobiaceae bacterium]MDI3493637.1 hypothetical protein [Desulfomicrobiaceae bacterium]HCF05391.1 hypothetical protein [Desulfomicrobiaceae bacterium]
MSYSQSDLPVRLRDGELLVLDDGTEIRWESSGEAKAVFLGDSFEPALELFPGQDTVLDAGGLKLKLTAFFEDALEVQEA